MNKSIVTFAAAALLGVASAQTTPAAVKPAVTPVVGQPANPLKMVLVRSQVVTTTDKAGKKVETLKPDVKGALPGQIFEDTNTATNVGKLPLAGVNITMNVTPGVYVSSVAGRSDVRALYSIDNGKTFAAAPLKKTVTVQENGKSVTKQVEVSPSEYTNVRFVVPSLKAGESLKTTVRFRVS